MAESLLLGAKEGSWPLNWLQTKVCAAEAPDTEEDFGDLCSELPNNTVADNLEA